MALRALASASMEQNPASLQAFANVSLEGVHRSPKRGWDSEKLLQTLSKAALQNVFEVLQSGRPERTANKEV